MATPEHAVFDLVLAELLRYWEVQGAPKAGQPAGGSVVVGGIDANADEAKVRNEREAVGREAFNAESFHAHLGLGGLQEGEATSNGAVLRLNEHHAAIRLQTAFRAHAVQRRYGHVSRNSAKFRGLLLYGEMVAYASLVLWNYSRGHSSGGSRQPHAPGDWLWARLVRLLRAPRRVYLVATTKPRLLVVDAISLRVVFFEIASSQGRIEFCSEGPAHFHVFSSTPNSHGHTVFGFTDIVGTASAWMELLGRDRHRLPCSQGLLSISRANSMHAMSFAPIHSGLVKERTPKKASWFLVLAGSRLLFYRASAIWSNAPPVRTLEITGLSSVSASSLCSTTGLLLLTPDSPANIELIMDTPNARDNWLVAIDQVITAQMNCITRRFGVQGLPHPGSLGSKDDLRISTSSNPQRVQAMRPSQWPIKTKSLAVIMVRV